MGKRITAASLAALVAMCASTASGQEQPDEPAAYGWQILVADGAAVGAGLAAAHLGRQDGDAAFADGAIAAWGAQMLGSLAIHAAHRRPAQGAAAAGGRLLAPPLTAAVALSGYCLTTGFDSGCAGDPARWGFIAGGVGASLVDALVVADAPPPERAHDWYGAPMLALDAASLALGGLVLAGIDDPGRRDYAFALTIPPYFLGAIGAPVIHGLHGNGLKALGSGALRLLVPVLVAGGGATGYCAVSAGADGCGDDGAALGWLGGTVLTAAADAFVLARDPVTGGDGATAGLVPYLHADPDGVYAGFILTR